MMKMIMSLETEALMRSVVKQFEQYISLSKKITPETLTTVKDIEEPGRLADVIASYLSLKIKDKQAILEIINVRQRLEKILAILNNEKEVLELERKIGQRVKKSMEKTQKEYYLREQMKAIQKELGEKDGKSSEVEEIKRLLDKKNPPPNIKEKVEKELERYEKMPPTSAESGVIRTYIDWLLNLPMDGTNGRSHRFEQSPKNIGCRPFRLRKTERTGFGVLGGSKVGQQN